MGDGSLETQEEFRWLLVEEEKGLMPQAERVERQRRKGIRGTEGQGREAGSWFAGRGKRSPRFH